MTPETARKFVSIFMHMDIFFKDMFNYTKMSKDEQKWIVDEFNKEMQSGSLVEIMTGMLDEEEAQYMIDVYSTPIGQRLVKKMPETLQAMAMDIELIMSRHLKL